MTEKVELTPELLRELQLKQLDMLVYFRDFCEKNNLTFYLIGGGLIGGLRKGGFLSGGGDVFVLVAREGPGLLKTFRLRREELSRVWWVAPCLNKKNK